MIVLLDTRILLWWLSDDPLLAEEARHVIRNRAGAVFVSAASAWEIAIKKASGKLDAPDNLAEVLRTSRLEMLPISVAHALAAGRLPRHHDDPFDRMLVAQAMLEGMTLLTHNTRLVVYGEFVLVI